MACLWLKTSGLCKSHHGRQVWPTLRNGGKDVALDLGGRGHHQCICYHRNVIELVVDVDTLGCLSACCSAQTF